jgi:chromosome segregation ATPase
MSQIQQPSPYDTANRGGGNIEPPDPNERLKQLQIELDQHNARIDHLSKQRDALNTDLTDLSTAVTAAKTTLTHYGSALQDLESRLHALQYFYDQKSKMILAAIGDKKGPIDELIRDFDHEIERMQARLRELGEMQDAAQKESQEATAVQTARQADYDAINQYQQNTTAKLTDMEGLRTQITQADENNDVASMYLEVLELHGRLRETQVVSQHQLAVDLRQRLGELEAAKEHARAKTAAYNAVQADYSAHLATLQAKQAGRRAKLLAEVQAMFPAPAPSATAGGTGSSATSTPSTTTPSTTTPSTTTPSAAASQASVHNK